MSISADTTLSLGWPVVEATNVVYMYQPTATAIINTIATITAISRLVIPFVFGIAVLLYLFKYFMVLSVLYTGGAVLTIYTAAWGGGVVTLACPSSSSPDA